MAKSNLNSKILYQLDFYDKIIKATLEKKEYDKFSHTKFDSYKECCKNCCFIILEKKGKTIEKSKNFHEIVVEIGINIKYYINF